MAVFDSIVDWTLSVENILIMKILLTKDVDTLGYKGEIFEVSDGYGRNYLIPQGFAVPATPGQLKMAENWRDQAAARRDQLRQENAALAERLRETDVSFVVKAGDKGRLYGSITTADIAGKIEEALGIELDRRKISVDGKAIRQTGEHTALVRLDANHQANVSVKVISEEELKAAAEKKDVVEEEIIDEDEYDDEFGSFEDDGEDAEDSILSEAVETVQDAVETTVEKVGDAIEAAGDILQDLVGSDADENG